MLFRAKRLTKFGVLTEDGDLGTVRDLYMDRRQWAVRYLLLDTKPLLPSKKSLISTISVKGVDVEEGIVRLNISEEQVENAPSIEDVEPVTRPYERELLQHYGYGYYWNATNIWGAFPYPNQLAASPYADESMVTEAEEKEEERKESSYLRSLKDLSGDWSGYTVQASGEKVGHIDDFIIESKDWQIRYLTLDTTRFAPSKSVLVSVDWITDINDRDLTVEINVLPERIENAPAYEEGQPLTTTYERKLYSHFEKPYDE
ncbi:PRC-barrel domain-containing protein [Salsuginibacillus kocurii]|uniref:PRC-barrel domain-containing protein n=1 Tax=Salsuginibacillus kocurii TaxID=427078 RepID=UPI00037B9CB5|nr:PRC-barrel domain-containing protein [Salsuginibacillus kocurii]